MLKLVFLVVSITYCAGLITNGKESMDVKTFLADKSNAKILAVAYATASK